MSSNTRPGRAPTEGSTSLLTARPAGEEVAADKKNVGDIDDFGRMGNDE